MVRHVRPWTRRAQLPVRDILKSDARRPVELVGQCAPRATKRAMPCIRACQATAYRLGIDAARLIAQSVLFDVNTRTAHTWCAVYSHVTGSQLGASLSAKSRSQIPSREGKRPPISGPTGVRPWFCPGSLPEFGPTEPNFGVKVVRRRTPDANGYRRQDCQGRRSRCCSRCRRSLQRSLVDSTATERWSAPLAMSLHHS